MSITMTDKNQEEYAVLVEQIREKITGMLEGGDPVDFFGPYLFPAIVGEQVDRIRRAVLLQLVTRRDVHGDRTRIHVLLCGPPGCGKTEILFWMRRYLGAFFIGPATSEVGLKGDARGVEIVPGELANAHGGVLCIDELDKFTSDRDALLESMEEGSYKIRKGMHSETFEAEVRILATANALSFSAPLLDRFDFIFQLYPPGREERKMIASSLVDSFLEPKGGVKVKVLQEYVEWCRDFEPRKEGAEEIKAILHSWIDQTDMEKTSVRAWEASILRVAYALAKLHRENLKPRWVNEAIRIKAEDDIARWRGGVIWNTKP